MKTLLVPVDFSETSKNAARYAAALAASLGDTKLVFYHAFNPVAAGIDGTPLDIDVEARRKIVEMALHNQELDIAPGLTTEVIAEEADSLTENLVKYVRYNDIDLVIMGLTGATRIEQILMGSNALKMAHEAIVPVLIVPPDATFKGINNILFATDMKNVKATTPLRQLRTLLSLFKANLHVVNVDSEHYVELTEEYRRERNTMESMLDGFSPEFYFVRIGDFVDAINTFTETKSIDLIITIPRRHNFLATLFTPSNTKRLLYHTHVPLVAIHE